MSDKEFPTNIVLTLGATVKVPTPVEPSDAVPKSYADSLVTSGVSDGDKGEIVVSGGGTIWSIDSGVIGTAKLADQSVTVPKISATGTASSITYLRGDGSWATVPSGGVTDGDKGEITVSSSGTVWSIDSGVIGTAKLADSAVTTAKLANQSVTPAKISATGTASNTTYLRGDGAWVTVSGGVSDGDKGEITVSSSGTVWSIDSGAIGTAKLADQSVTVPKISATGTASSITYLRGDGSWATVSGGEGGSLSPAQIRDSLATLTGNDRLDASAIKNLPTGGGSGGLNIVSPTSNNFLVVANDLVVANNFSVALPSTPQENTIIYFLVLENPCLITVTGTITLNSQMSVNSFKINPQGFIIPLLFNSRWNILPSYVSDILLDVINLTNYQSPGDANGIIYYLGTTAINSQTFVNPVPTQVVATSSGLHVDVSFGHSLQGATDRNLNTAWHANNISPTSQIFQLDFQNRKVNLTRIVIRPWAWIDGAVKVSPTIVEGSNDGSNWTDIHSFTSGVLAGQDLISPEIPASGTLSRYIRFRRTSGTSSTWWQQALGEIELYGFLTT
jgi:hypothetical protein